MEERLEVEKHPSSVPKLKRSAGKEGPTFSKLVSPHHHHVHVRKRSFTYRGNSSAKVTTDAEESGNGSPCYRHPFETSDTSDKRRGMEANSPRKGGKVWGNGRGKSKRTGMRASFALLHLTSPLLTGSIPFHPSSFLNLSSPPFVLSFFLSVPCLCGPRSSSFDSIPFPAIHEIRFFSFGHRFTAHFQPACV